MGDQKSFGPKIFFLTKKCSWTKNFFGPKIFSDQKYFGIKKFSDQKYSGIKNFFDKIPFPTEIFFGPKICLEKYIRLKDKSCMNKRRLDSCHFCDINLCAKFQTCA